MKHIKKYILFENIQEDIKLKWLDAVNDDDLETIKSLLKQGVDVNTTNDFGESALIYARSADMTNLLLAQPTIDINNKDTHGNSFSKVIFTRIWLKDEYELQKTIIKNDRMDIISLLNKYGMINPKIKNEYPALFTGLDLNLL